MDPITVHPVIAAADEDAVHDHCTYQLLGAAEELRRLRSLLSRYLRVVKDREGRDYLDTGLAQMVFSHDEVEEIKRMARRAEIL